MAVPELDRIEEIDRSEHITQEYKSRDGVLELVDLDVQAPRWGEPGEHPIQHYIDSWKSLLDAGGVLLGAFDGESLAGLAIYEPASSEGFAILAVLHVSRTYRRKGVGRDLAQEVMALARADGADRLYVSATPTRSTVDFYRRQGFEPLVTPNARLFALEPDDIHMEMRLWAVARRAGDGPPYAATPAGVSRSPTVAPRRGAEAWRRACRPSSRSSCRSWPSGCARAPLIRRRTTNAR